MASVSAEELFNEGIAHAMRGDMLRAEHYLNAAKAQGYDPAEAVAWLVSVCVASSRYNAALGHAEPYLRRHPEDWSLHFVVANIQDALGNVDAARRHLERVVALAPGQPLPHYRLGLFYRERLGDQEASEIHFAEYIRLAPAGPHAAEAGDALRARHPTEQGPKRIEYPKSHGHGGTQ